MIFDDQQEALGDGSDPNERARWQARERMGRQGEEAVGGHHGVLLAEPAFAALGPPTLAGVFGTLEQCHERVIALAHAGVTDLRCVLPNAPDIHDVIAQATAMTVGTVAKLAPGAPRSPAPPPPEGWGGRSRFPRPSA